MKRIAPLVFMLSLSSCTTTLTTPDHIGLERQTLPGTDGEREQIYLTGLDTNEIQMLPELCWAAALVILFRAQGLVATQLRMIEIVHGIPRGEKTELELLASDVGGRAASPSVIESAFGNDQVGQLRDGQAVYVDVDIEILGDSQDPLDDSVVDELHQRRPVVIGVAPSDGRPHGHVHILCGITTTPGSRAARDVTHVMLLDPAKGTFEQWSRQKLRERARMVLTLEPYERWSILSFHASASAGHYYVEL